MNWDAISGIGEIVGAVAVVISLVYVAAQIRQNSRVSKSVAIQNWATASALEKSSVFQDPEFAKLYKKGCNSYDDLDEVEEVRFRMYLIQFFNSFELLFFSCETGTVDRDFFEAKADGYAGMLSNSGVLKFWNERKTKLYDKRFRDFVDSKLAGM